MKNKKTKLITLGLIAIIIVVVLSVSLTQAFMKPINETSSVTEVSLTSCAKISLTDSSSVDLNNSYPMSRNKALQTTPYSFTVNSLCEGYVGFNLYIATLSTNTLDAIKVHYILTYKDSKTALAEGTLTTDKIVTNEFSEAEKTEYNAGMKGTLSNIYKIYELNLSEATSYDLYLYIDSDAGNETMNKIFKAGVAIKAFDRESTFADYIIDQYSEQGVNGLYHHDGTLENGIDDGSYRYAGDDYQLTEKAINEGYSKILSTAEDDTGNLINIYCDDTKSHFQTSCSSGNVYYTIADLPTQYTITYYEIFRQAENLEYLKPLVKNYVCFGSDEEVCPDDNLYRIIGVFGDQVKLIKAYEAGENVLGKAPDETRAVGSYATYYSYKGKLTSTIGYVWNGDKNIKSNIWADSLLNTDILNGKNGQTFLTILGEYWTNKIADTYWIISGGISKLMGDQYAKITYQTEIESQTAQKYNAKIGLLYASDYAFSASPENWKTRFYEYSNTTNRHNNWLYLGVMYWTISPLTPGTTNVYTISSGGNFNYNGVNTTYIAVRPTFYLNSNVKYVSGTGTETDPYRIA